MDTILSIFKRRRSGSAEDQKKSPTEQAEAKVVVGRKYVGNNNSDEAEKECRDLEGTVYDLIRTIRDPEKPGTLEDLHVVDEDSVKVEELSPGVYWVRLEFQPTVPHCSLATLIGLCLRVRLERSLAEKIKLDIRIRKGSHATEDDINKQINDKERVAAALENPNLRRLVDECVDDPD